MRCMGKMQQTQAQEAISSLPFASGGNLNFIVHASLEKMYFDMGLYIGKPLLGHVLFLVSKI